MWRRRVLKVAVQRHEAEIESWAVVLGLSNRTIELAKQLLQRVIYRKVYSMSKPLLALYAASIVTGEYIPLSLFINKAPVRRSTGRISVARIKPKLVRFDVKKRFGIELSVEKMVEVEVRGFCRLLKLDPMLCEAATCVTLCTLSDIPYIIERNYAKFVLSIIRFVAKRLNISIRVAPFLPYNRRFSRLSTKKAEKYVDVCVERARRAVAMQLQ